MRLPLASVFVLTLVLFVSVLCPGAHSAEPFFQKGDIVAIAGGEDMVVAGETGYLELFLTRGLPDYHLRFRNLAWEGDTVFEQRRELNFPTWDEQFAKTGATVVIAQFGEMESFAGLDGLPAFVEAYGKLVDEFSGGGKRRVILLSPAGFDTSYTSLLPSSSRIYNADPDSMRAREKVLNAYTDAIEKLAKAKNCRFHRLFIGVPDARYHRDGVHYDDFGQASAADHFRQEFAVPETLKSAEELAAKNPLRQLIVAKNKLWFDYWRPQNWAFLAGDRTSQPSSRDYLDPSKRWFPPEREQFLPLIEAKEKEIDALAAQLAK